jgi:hypothetical protein
MALGGGQDMDGNADGRTRLAAILAVIGGVIAIISVFITAFRITGQGANTTEKLINDWEGKVALVTGAVMVLGGALIWFSSRGQARTRVGMAISVASLVAIGTAIYAIAVFKNQALDALAEAFGQAQGAPASVVRPQLVQAVNAGALKLSPKLGVPILIVGAVVALIGGILALARRERA